MPTAVLLNTRKVIPTDMNPKIMAIRAVSSSLSRMEISTERRSSMAAPSYILLEQEAFVYFDIMKSKLKPKEIMIKANEVTCARVQWLVAFAAVIKYLHSSNFDPSVVFFICARNLHNSNELFTLARDLCLLVIRYSPPNKLRKPDLTSNIERIFNVMVNGYTIPKEDYKTFLDSAVGKCLADEQGKNFLEKIKYKMEPRTLFSEAVDKNRHKLRLSEMVIQISKSKEEYIVTFDKYKAFLGRKWKDIIERFFLEAVKTTIQRYFNMDGNIRMQRSNCSFETMFNLGDSHKDYSDYAKDLNDLVTKKRRLSMFETFQIVLESKTIFQDKLNCTQIIEMLKFNMTVAYTDFAIFPKFWGTVRGMSEKLRNEKIDTRQYRELISYIRNLLSSISY
ncbi:MAG: hypothetical protein HRT90_12160 [Candidatus Margulisbacteria bacterium]|nr:hypothetical protein [Candidatus Margulisiibacteriota bacterium]